MNKYKLLFIIALIIFILISIFSYLNFKKENNNLINKINKATEEINLYYNNYYSMLIKNNELQKQNIELQKKVDEAIKKTADLEKTIEEKQNRISELEKERPTTPVGCEEVVAHYLKEIDVWKESFSLVSQERDYFKLTIYPAVVEENKNLNLTVVNLQNQLNEANNLLEIQKKLMDETKKELSKNNSVFKITKITAGILAGVLIYSLVK